MVIIICIGMNITNASLVQPHFTIKKSRIVDAGYYRCYRYVMDHSLRVLSSSLLVETIVQISSKYTDMNEWI